MATVDPLAALTYALSCPTDSQEQVQGLKALRILLETQPATAPTILPALLTSCTSIKDSVFKRWTIDLFHYAIGTPSLNLDVRTQLAAECLELAATLLATADNVPILKLVIQCFCNIYPLLFRLLADNRSNRQPWDVLTIAKLRIIEFVGNPATPDVIPNVSHGIQLAALKFVQRVILCQTRGVSDPRLQNRADPNLSFCPTDHPFMNASALETEGTQLLSLITTHLYTSPNVDLVTAIINVFGAIAKLRPGLLQFLVEALGNWTPSRLPPESTTRVRSADKVNFILLNHILRSGLGKPYALEITTALERISERIKKVARDDHARRAAELERKRALAAATAAEATQPSEAKRIKLDPGPASSAPPVAGPSRGAPPNSASAALANFNFAELPASLVTNLIIANLSHFSEQDVLATITAYRQSNPAEASNDPRAVARDAAPQDPLKSDIDDEEMEYEPDKLNMQLELAGADGDELKDAIDLAQLTSTSFELPPPKELDQAASDAFVLSSMARIAAAGTEQMQPVLAAASAAAAAALEDGTAVIPPVHAATKGLPPTEMWMLLVIRMITRGQRSSNSSSSSKTTLAGVKAEEGDADMSVDKKGKGRALDVDLAGQRNDALRQLICDYVMVDFPARVRLATLWLNEEWYNDDIRGTNIPKRRNYELWLGRLLESYRPRLDAADKTLMRFLLDMPEIPTPVFNFLRELCVNSTTTVPGFNALREIVILRPPIRMEALNILLELTTHPESLTRIAAINTVKKWVPDVKPMDAMTRRFAVRLLKRLETRRKPPGETTVPSKPGDDAVQNGADDTGMTDGQDAVEDGEEVPDPADSIPLTTPYLPETLRIPAEKGQVLQHSQLLFALSVKVPELLDEIFFSYNRMEDSVQVAVQDLLTPLIRSLGSSHGKLLTLLRTFSAGAESLALGVLKILTESGRPSGPLVALVKSLIAERNLDARFLIPIIAELDKNEITRQLPRVVSMLNGKPEAKGLVRSVFIAIVEPPPQSFGQVSTNLPRVRESELLKPAELLALLHDTDKITLKCAMEAIDICFGLTGLFTSDVFAVAMQQIIDDSAIPYLFMRTVIQAVKTYNTLTQFVAGTLMSRLILKKIWTFPALWDGFMLCAKIIAPASYAALLQLPPERLGEVAEKHQSLRAGLREHVIKKGGSKSKILKVLGGEEPGSIQAAPPVAVASPSA